MQSYSILQTIDCDEMMVIAMTLQGGGLKHPQQTCKKSEGSFTF
jgi:hypothetical protein